VFLAGRLPGNRMLPEALETALALVKAGQKARVRAEATRLEHDVSRFPYGWALRVAVTWDVTCYNVTRPSKMSVEERVKAASIRKQVTYADVC